MSNKDDICERLRRLLQIVCDDEADDYEAEAYACAIDDIYAYFNTLLDGCFVETAQGKPLNEWCRLFGIPYALDETDRRELLSQKIKTVPTHHTPECFEDGIRAINDNAVISANNFVVTIDIPKADMIADIGEISALVEKRLPAGLVARGTGSGLTWAEWDSLNRTVMQHNEKSAPFSLLGSI